MTGSGRPLTTRPLTNEALQLGKTEKRRTKRWVQKRAESVDSQAATSVQERLPPGFKHITKGRKRN